MHKAFDRLQEEFMMACLERHPQEASYLGYTHLDGEMPSGKLEDRIKEIEQNKCYLEKFKEIEESDLDFDRKITRNLAIHKLRLWIFIDEILEHYLMDPNAANEVSSALESLFIRSGPERFYPLLNRLKKTPQYIEDYKSRVKKPIKLWTEMAIEGAEGLIEFLPVIVLVSKGELPQIASEIESAAKNVEKALLGYISFLENLLPTTTGTWAMGRENFDTLLSLRKLPYDGDEMLTLGEKWLSEEKETLLRLAESTTPVKSVDEIISMAKSQHPPTFQDVLNLYRLYIEKSREFVITHDVVTMPEGEILKVIETPEYIRYQLPLAAYLPAPAVGEKRIGYYMVTPPQDPKILGEHNETAIANVSVHEAYPGHHVQIFCSNNHPHKIRWTSIPTDTYAKFVSEGSELVEGWAHYCEEYMQKAGFITTPEYLFTQTLQAIFRAVRIILDVKLARGEMTFDEAVSFLERESGLEHYAAVAEVKRYTIGPSYPLSYLLGKHMIKDLKEKVRAMMGPRFSDKFFHDTIIYEGTMPIALMEQIFEHTIQSLQ
jgi:uncharacterized protein (DUF885 family)